jgi:hypothetical protein
MKAVGLVPRHASHGLPGDAAQGELRGCDLAIVSGSGPAGRISAQDRERAATIFVQD